MTPTEQPYARPIAIFEFGDMVVEYLQTVETQTVGLTLYPKPSANKVVRRREYLNTPEVLAMPGSKKNSLRAWVMDSLVQLKLIGDDTEGYPQGRTMRNSTTLADLRFDRQDVQDDGETAVITTHLISPRGFAVEHALTWRKGSSGLVIQTTFHNTGKDPLTLEMLASFSLGGLSPFAADDAPGRLYLHRFRSYWSAEGRHDCQMIEEMGLERSWLHHAPRAERFGQVGSMPVRGFFPFIAVEDRQAGVFWGAQVGWAGSWQMEAYRKDDCLCISGGLADREFGHWMKVVAPGGSLSTPLAMISTVKGDLDDLCDRLTSLQAPAVDKAPASEQSLPVICNEWCTSWGDPNHAEMVAMADKLRGASVKYLVIDAGWYKGDSGVWNLAQGDWQPNPRLFPQGLKATAAAVRERGLIPGIWFEFEVAGNQSPAFQMTDHLLKRDGMPVTASGRRFWDLRDPWVVDYLSQKVIGLLRDCNIGYIKVDYNETIGIGVDGAESLGEGLRQHIAGMQAFFAKLRTELPDLVIENCASGGHRLEPSMMGLVSMASFSDVHEGAEIPIVAANLQRLILPRQSQIWAVLHKTDSTQRLAYSLAAGFLGRLCLSGEIEALDADRWALTQQAVNFYNRVAPVIKDGKSRLYQSIGPSWRHPTGAQVVWRASRDGQQALAVVHSFANPLPKEIAIELPDASEAWHIAGSFPEGSGLPALAKNSLVFSPAGEFQGQVVHLVRK